MSAGPVKNSRGVNMFTVLTVMSPMHGGPALIYIRRCVLKEPNAKYANSFQYNMITLKTSDEKRAVATPSCILVVQKSAKQLTVVRNKFAQLAEN